jgi:hypothetical protein
MTDAFPRPNHARIEALIHKHQFSPVIDGTEYSVPISTGGTFASGTSQSALLLNRQSKRCVSAAQSRNEILFGGDLIRAHNGGNSKEFGGPIYLGELVYETCSMSLTFCESPAYPGDLSSVQSDTQSYGNGNYTVHDTLGSAFVQDNYRMRPDFYRKPGPAL